MNEEHNQKVIVKNQVLKPLAESASIDELLLQLDNAKSRLSELAVAAIANQEYGTIEQLQCETIKFVEHLIDTVIQHSVDIATTSALSKIQDKIPQ